MTCNKSEKGEIAVLVSNRSRGVIAMVRCLAPKGLAFLSTQTQTQSR